MATIAALAYVVLMGLLKEGITDYKRNHHYKKENCQPCTRLALSCRSQNSSFVEIASRADQIKVDKLIRIKDGDIHPADCIELASY